MCTVPRVVLAVIAAAAITVPRASFADPDPAAGDHNTAPPPVPVPPATLPAPADARTETPGISPDVRVLADELARLRARQEVLEQRAAAADARAAAVQAGTPEETPGQKAVRRAVSFSAAPGNGLTLTVPDGLFSMSLRPRAQVRDTVTMQGGQPTTNEINVKTVRLWIQGYVLTKDLQYGVQLAFGGNDFDAGSSSPIFDAFIDYGRLRDMHIKVGQFFVPFDRSRTIREFALQLVDRAQMVTELSLDRDVGISLYSNDIGGYRGIFGYAVGFFGGDGKNRFGGQPNGFLYTGRFVVRPFGPFDDDLEGDLSRLKKPRLAIGVAGAYNNSTTRQKSTTGNVLTLGTFDYDHADADVVFKYGGFSFLGEFLLRKSREGSNTKTVMSVLQREWSRSALGYTLQAGMMVHKKIEIAARYDDLRKIGQTDPTLVTLVNKTGKEIDAGVNLYLNGHAFKIQSDYVYLFGSQIEHGRHAVRIQLDASF